MAIHQSKIYRALGGDMRKLDELCAQFAAGRSAQDLKQWIAQHAVWGEACPDGEALALNDQNISDFRAGYYAKWQKRNEQSQALRERAATASRIIREARASGASIAEAAELSAAATLAEVLESFDPATLQSLLATKPEQYLAVINSLARISGSESARRKLESDLAESRARIAALAAKTQADKERLRDRVAALAAAIRANEKTPTAATQRAEMLRALTEAIDSL